MKRKHILHRLLLIACILCSCTLLANGEEPNYKLLSEELIQGQAVSIAFSKSLIKKYDINDIYACFLYYKQNDSRFHSNKTIKVSSEDEKYIIFTDTIPLNSSTLTVDLFYGNNGFSLERSFEYRILTPDSTVELGAFSKCLLQSAKSDDYLDFFKLNREIYPNDIIIYTSKWFAEQTNGNFSKGLIAKDIEDIKNASFDEEGKGLLLFIANTFHNMVLDTANYKYVKQLKNSEYLNNELFSLLLNDALKHTLSDFDYNAIATELMLNNLYSKYTEMKIATGELFTISTHEVVDHICKSLYESNPNNVYYLIVYAESTKLLEPKTSLSLLDKLIEISKSGDLRNQGYWGNMLALKKGIIIGTIEEATHWLNMRSKGIEMVNEFEKYYDENDATSLSYLYYIKAKMFENINPDSSMFYYPMSYKLFPYSKATKRDFAIFAKAKMKIDKGEDYLVYLSENIDFKATPLSEDTPIITLKSGEKINLREVDYPVLIVKSSLSCPYCDKEIIDLYKKIDKPLTLIYTNEKHFAKMQKRKKAKNPHIRALCISNSTEVESYFSLSALPSSVYIRSGKILLKFNGFNENNALLLK